MKAKEPAPPIDLFDDELAAIIDKRRRVELRLAQLREDPDARMFGGLRADAEEDVEREDIERGLA